MALTAKKALGIAKAYTDSVALGKGAVQIPGPPGRQVEIQSTATHVQWRYVGDKTWIDLYALPAPGRDGESPEFRVVDRELQYKFATRVPTSWTTLYTFPFAEAVSGDVFSLGSIAPDPDDVKFWFPLKV